MSQKTEAQAAHSQISAAQWNSLSRLGGIAALSQLALILFSLITLTIVGGEPATAVEYFDSLNGNRLAGLLRLDFGTLILISLMCITVFGIFANQRRCNGAYASLGMASVFVGVILALATHSAFAMIRLADQFALATTVVQQQQLLAAGEAIIGSDMWHSTAGFMAGIFMQGGFVLLSAIMLQTRTFSKGTAVTGLLANGFDLVHVFVGLVAPSLAAALLMIGGAFYLLWFPLLGRDLLRLGRYTTAQERKVDLTSLPERA